MKILIIGHFGGRNIGDELILLSQMQLFKKKYNNAEFLIFTYDERFTQEIYQSYGYKVSTVQAFGLRKSLTSVQDQIKKIKNIDFAILGGGGLIQDVYFSYGPFRYLIPVYICLLRNIPIYSFAVGVNDLRYKCNKTLFNGFLEHASGVSVRDEVSERNIKSLVGDSIKVDRIPDSALSLNMEEYFQSEIKAIESYTITLIFREFFEPYLEDIKYLILTLQKITSSKKLNIIVFENNPAEFYLAKKMKHLFSENNINVEIYNTINPIKYLISLQESQVVVSGRLHGILPSKLLKKNLVCLTYAPKIESFCKQYGYAYLDFEDLTDIKNKKIEDYINIISEDQESQKINLKPTEDYIDKIDHTYLKKENISTIKKIKLAVSLCFMGGYLLVVHAVNRIRKIKIEKE